MIIMAILVAIFIVIMIIIIVVVFVSILFIGASSIGDNTTITVSYCFNPPGGSRGPRPHPRPGERRRGPLRRAAFRPVRGPRRESPPLPGGRGPRRRVMRC